MIAGVITGSAEFIARLIDVNHGSVMLNGPVMDPRIAHELYLRLDHLPLRVQAHSKAAAFLASRMEAEKIPVVYPGSASHAQHELMASLINPGFGYGGMISVDCLTSAKAMELATTLQEVKFGLYAVSLGFSRTLLSCPSVSTSSEIPIEEQKLMSLSPGLLRMSVGYTGDDEIMWERFIQTYRKVIG